MLCWGSWANTQKMAAANWRFELFYWDYVAGILLMSLLFAFTLGSTGSHGRSFMEDIYQASAGNLLSAFTGGVIFNAANILLVAAIAIAGMSVAFPVGIGIALGVAIGAAFGVVLNNLALGVGFGICIGVAIALALSMRRSGKNSGGGRDAESNADSNRDGA